MKKDPTRQNRHIDRPVGLDSQETQSTDLSESTQKLPAEEESGSGRWGSLVLRDRLGEGGFAEVYRAWDPTLQREVALKLLKPSSHGSVTQKEDILREGRLLAKIRHQNVATVHGVAEHDGVVGLWMELVRGTSLEKLLETNGPFSARECIGIGIEVSEALRAVHNAGLVHGDISARNLVREDGGRLVLIDFGLGVRQAGPATTDSPRAVAGTPAYMAPEMLRGAHPSIASDVYAVGVLLYHLATGEYPVKRGDLRLEAGPEPAHPRLLRDQRSDIPESLCAVVERALAPDPAERFQSIGELQVALEECWRPGSATPSRSRRWFWAAATASGLVLLTLLVVLYYMTGSHVRTLEGSTLVLADLSNETEDRQLDGITSLLRGQLDQSASFNLLEESVVREVLQRMARAADAPVTQKVAREVAWREGAPLIVSGQLSPLGKSYVLNLSLEKMGPDPESPEQTWTRSFRAEDKNNLFEAIDKGAAWVRGVIGKTPAEAGPKMLPSREATTASWEALNLFTRAEELQEKGKSYDAILLFEEAVRIDPDFALAHMRIGDIKVSLGLHREGYEAWQKARTKVRSVRLTRKEELRIEGVYAFDTNDFKGAESTFHTFSLQYPNDYYPFFMHAFALRAQGRYQEAIEQLEQAGAKRPSLFYIPAQLARTWMLMGRVDLARQQAARLRAMHQNEWALVMEGSCDFMEQRFDQAEARFRELAGSADPEWKSDGSAMLAYLLGERGRFQDAKEVLEQGISHDTQYELGSRKADKLIARAYLAYRSGQPAACRTACLEAVALESGPLRLARAGSLLARSGAIHQAEELLRRLDREPDAPVFQLAKDRIQGELLLARKEYPEAIRLLREAALAEPFYATKEYVARALAESGRNSEALEECSSIENSAAKSWQLPETEFPGVYAEALLRCAGIAASLNRSSQSGEVRNLYRKLRPSGRQPTADR